MTGGHVVNCRYLGPIFGVSLYGTLRVGVYNGSVDLSLCSVPGSS